MKITRPKVPGEDCQVLQSHGFLLSPGDILLRVKGAIIFTREDVSSFLAIHSK